MQANKLRHLTIAELSDRIQSRYRQRHDESLQRQRAFSALRDALEHAPRPRLAPK